MTYIFRTDYNTASKILSECYEKDHSATFSNKRKSLTGSVLSAFIKHDEKGCTVSVQSNYYTLCSLKEMPSLLPLIEQWEKEKKVRRLLNEDEEFMKENCI